jgi:hypothetical protein
MLASLPYLTMHVYIVRCLRFDGLATTLFVGHSLWHHAVVLAGSWLYQACYRGQMLRQLYCWCKTLHVTSNAGS